MTDYQSPYEWWKVNGERFDMCYTTAIERDDDGCPVMYNGLKLEVVKVPSPFDE